MHHNEIEDRADAMAWHYATSSLAMHAAFGTPLDAAEVKRVLREAQEYANKNVRAPQDHPHSSHVQNQYASAREFHERVRVQ